MSVYDDLLKVGNGKLLERAVERAVVQLIEGYSEQFMLLYNAKVYTSVRGIPLVFGQVKQDEMGNAMEEARDNSSYIVIICSGYTEDDGDARVKMRVVVSTNIYDTDPEAQQHERWCAAVRGILSKSAWDDEVGLMVNNLQSEVRVSGWEPDDTPVTDNYTGNSWVHEASYDVCGNLTYTE